MSSTTTRRDQAAEHVEKAKEAASGAGDKLKEAASQAGQVASNVAAAAGSAIGSAASTVGRKAEDATAAVGRGTEWLGEKIQEKGPESGILGKASHAIGSGLESAGKYLEEKKLSGMADDLGGLIRRNPIPALLIGVGLGFLLGRMMTSSRS